MKINKKTVQSDLKRFLPDSTMKQCFTQAWVISIMKQTICKNIQFAETFSKYVNMIVLQNIEEFRNYPLCRDL